jgi:hypothetical protein
VPVAIDKKFLHNLQTLSLSHSPSSWTIKTTISFTQHIHYHGIGIDRLKKLCSIFAGTFFLSLIENCCCFFVAAGLVSGGGC